MTKKYNVFKTKIQLGTIVLVTRGGENSPKGTIGCKRDILGVLVGETRTEYVICLLEDDPLAGNNYCTKKGDIGEWCKTIVRPSEKVNKLTRVSYKKKSME